MDDRISSSSLSTTRIVRSHGLRAVDRRRILVHTVAEAVADLLEEGLSNPDGMIVTVHNQTNDHHDDDDLVVTVTTPEYEYITIR